MESVAHGVGGTDAGWINGVSLKVWSAPRWAGAEREGGAGDGGAVGSLMMYMAFVHEYGKNPCHLGVTGVFPGSCIPPWGGGKQRGGGLDLVVVVLVLGFVGLD